MAQSLWNGSDADSFGETARAVTPGAAINPVAKSVVVTDITGGSNLSIVTTDGSIVPFVGVYVGFTVPYRVSQVNTSGTTCTCYTID